MSLVRHYKPSVRMEYEELDGLIRSINESLEEDEVDGEIARAAFIGALIALKIIRHHERVEYPHQFISLFKHYLDTPTEEREV